MKLFSWNQLLPLKLISVHLYNVLPIFVNEMCVSIFRSHLKNFIATKKMYWMAAMVQRPRDIKTSIFFLLLFTSNFLSNAFNFLREVFWDDFSPWPIMQIMQKSAAKSSQFPDNQMPFQKWLAISNLIGEKWEFLFAARFVYSWVRAVVSLPRLSSSFPIH